MVDINGIMDNLPSVIPRDPGSVIRRYVASHEEDVQTYEDRLDTVMESHQIDHATGDELDQIGAFFGKLGRRRGRSDQEYRIYLKTIVQAFKGRGTVPGIQSAVAAGLNTVPEEINISEDFQNLEYEILMTEWEPHEAATISELAELSDASVAKLTSIVYQPSSAKEAVGVTDDFVVQPSPIISDKAGFSESVAISPNKNTYSDQMGVSEAVTLDGNTHTIGDDMGADETVTIDDNKHTVGDDMGVSESVSYEVNPIAWGSNWGEMRWDT